MRPEAMRRRNGFDRRAGRQRRLRLGLHIVRKRFNLGNVVLSHDPCRRNVTGKLAAERLALNLSG